MIATLIPINGDESDEALKQIAWEMFALAHPIESYDADQERFTKWFLNRYPTWTREMLMEHIDEFRKQNAEEMKP